LSGRLAISLGLPGPLGITVADGGVNVAVFSANADRVWFCPFDDAGSIEIARLPLERIGDVHCGFVAGVGSGTRYGLRADGPFEPERGHRFDPSKLLVDPYATRLDRPFAHAAELAFPRAAEFDTAALVPKAIVPSPSATNIAASRHPAGRPGFIYEIAVKAFTKNHPDMPESLRGTVAALAHPAVIDHLVRLGVETVELMPIAAWIDERHLPSRGLANSWGYNPVVFMAPDLRIAPRGLGEVRGAVAALHEAGIRVVLDAVFNHTGESDELGATLSLRGLDNAVYYRLSAHEPGGYVNDTGTGNALACHREPVVRLVVDSMRHWVEAAGIDGFRLDLAAILGRGEDGTFRQDSPLLAAIEEDSILARKVVIAEPWDIGSGGYQLGNFPPRWLEWNDRFRDDIRRFWRGDGGSLGTLATRLAGSADIFRRPGRAPSASVNFLAAHDGFTLNDLVSYAGKHNEANAEDNRDGTNENFSWNCGVEGVAGDPDIEAARRRDITAMLATLFVSRGTPMLTAGDEMRRTQSGNNNAYCQDNAITWFDWTALDKGLAAFTARLSSVRKGHPSLIDDRFLSGEAPEASAIPDATWLHPDGREMNEADWAGEGRVLGMQLHAAGDRTLTWINGSPENCRAWLPPPRPGHAWVLLIDSSDTELADAAPLVTRQVSLLARSVRIYAETPEV
jgi:glycogen operon protein